MFDDRSIEAAVPGVPAVERRIGNPARAARIGRRNAGLRQLLRPQGLFLRKSRFALSSFFFCSHVAPNFKAGKTQASRVSEPDTSTTAP